MRRIALYTASPDLAANAMGTLQSGLGRDRDHYSLAKAQREAPVNGLRDNETTRGSFLGGLLASVTGYRYIPKLVSLGR